MNTEITAIILAGGKSSRMGRDKSLLRLGNITLIEHVIMSIRPYVKSILIVTNEQEKYSFLNNVRFVPDIEKDQGPLIGLISGISAVDTTWSFITSCDMPLINGGIINVLVKNIDGYVVAPLSSMGFEPMLSLYSTQVLPYAFEFIKDNKKSVNGFISFMDKLNLVKTIDRELIIKEFGKEMLFNINDEVDYNSLLEVFNG
ncbi:MAG: molybdenum cofactor guanylyltransferase [Firmicutes bacterium]|nr:molybdenum cofactor guanylyltransferase [Bacillota bacterium]